MKQLALLSVGNILEFDDGVAVYASQYLEKNYTFSPQTDIINGGVEGINLLNLFMEYKHIIILDAIEIDDKPGSIYHIPSNELTGYGLNSGGAHEIGVLQCFDILELMGKEIPKSSIIGIVPQKIDVCIGLSMTMQKTFCTYIDTVITILQKEGIQVSKNEYPVSLEAIIENFKNPLNR
ncbi:HyaD/HybD family hydrogenase maturation endopeptidase [Sulfurimonas sp. SWIR-19]|uniref:HyaD/HybD family hydrogenase maturation endopeptidase n=1 Tax=Sulfurimonas sp. SWIR-19 TaxID=2878390 RepID=UPI001CF15DEE|nr:HyaD/HybD family hydrogenase maturation endopeptidase [Sulfurimonas sp. SWIR-19]UCN01292.1 HyaD/HybD family hydrogenase maturation endopeptidase [Sulfurimonas sp. SWIR-19]